MCLISIRRKSKKSEKRNKEISKEKDEGRNEWEKEK
ncbi:hypothetical protein BCD_1042 (plasmid) [Borrelia crocidurae DOU]|uniref:Uncharacterized protein n=1 Tax=Borrelia crocidurae DOU TaxID=1293575 RepID=W5SKC3_9SPIR|nr:hypothetical protein BCD_1042 [Borrelia crocidurae DOU]